MRVRSLSHVGITVKDFDKAVRWYWEVFKFPLLSDMSMDAEALSEKKKLYNLPDGISVRFGFLRTPKGGVIEIFNFSETKEMTHCWNKPGAHHFALDTKKVHKWYEILSSRDDVEILNAPVFSAGAWWFFFRDPDGNLVELIDLRSNYTAVRLLGGIVGFFMRKGKFKHIYKGK